MEGYLGQSEPPGTAPLPWVGACGAVLDAQGRLWTASGQELFVFAQAADGSWSCVRRVKTPIDVRPYPGIVGDGERAFFLGGDTKLYAVDLTSGAATAVAAVPAKLAAFAVAPAGLDRGYAARAKYFVLLGNDVQACSAAGEDLGVVLALPPLEKDVHYTSVGLEPSSGDLLVGSYYPDLKIYRYTPAEVEVTTGGWPRTGLGCKELLAQDGLAWALLEDGSVLSLPPTLFRPTDAIALGPYWTLYPDGFVREATGGSWIASSQGLVHFDASGHTTGQRLGGLTGLRSLMIGPDGTVIAALERGQLMLRLGLDDGPTTPLRSHVNEPWRIGAGWSGRACGLAAERDTFLVLDEVGQRLWRFDPLHTAWMEKPWVGLNPAGTFTAPRALALGDTVAWVLEGNQLLAVPLSDLEHPVPAELPGVAPAAVQFLAGLGGDRLVAATGDHLGAFARTETGAYAALWEGATPLQKIVALAASPDYVALADSGAQALFLLRAQDGKLLAQMDFAAVPGGLSPTALALQGPWLLVADETGKRLVRLHILPARGA